MKKVILGLALVSTTHLFSMDLMTQHAMNAVVVKIASATVDTKIDHSESSQPKEVDNEPR